MTTHAALAHRHRGLNCLDDPPRMTIRQQRSENRMVQLVTAANRLVETEQRQTGQCQIAHHVENLVRTHSSA